MTVTYERTMSWFCAEPCRMRSLFWLTLIYGLVRAEATRGWPILKFMIES